jgi:uncharacterized integral membrane protein
MRTTIKLIIALAVIILAVSFVLENPWINRTYEIHYFGYRTIPIHLSLIILVAVLLGAVMTSVSMLMSQLRLKKTIRQQEKKLRQLEEELNSLRNLPLMESNIDKKPTVEPIPESR